MSDEVEKPIHLLRPSADHSSLVAEPAAIRRLAELGQVSVLSLVGSQRGGKSTLMNLLHARQLKGFQVGHYMDPQTFGLWVWPRVHPRCPEVTVLLLDTEGLDSPHVPPHYNWLISALTVMLSDVFMYQTKGSIEQTATERLDMILRVAEQLGRSDATSTESQSRPGAGTFLWLLRDHQLNMRRAPKDELTDKLDPAQARSLTRAFSDYDCVPLPRPADSATLRDLDQLNFEDLSSDFREEFVVLERRLWSLLGEPRELLGRSLTGAGLAELLQNYIAAIDRRNGVLGDICQMPTQRELLGQLAERRAMEAGVRRYEASLQSARLRGEDALLPVPPAELLSAPEAAREAAREAAQLELAAASIDHDVEATLERLEAQLAAWTWRRSVRASEDGVPVLVETRCLEGGLLADVWEENARRARPAFESWRACLGRSERRSEFRSLAGPYGSVEGPLLGLLGDELTLDVARGELQEQLERQRAELLASQEALAVELRACLQQVEARLTEEVSRSAAQLDVQCQEASARLADAVRESEARSREQAVALARSYTNERLEASQAAAALSLQQLEATTREALAEHRSAAALKEQSAGEAVERLAEAVKLAESRNQEVTTELRRAAEAAETRLREELAVVTLRHDEHWRSAEARGEELRLEASGRLERETTALKELIVASDADRAKALRAVEDRVARLDVSTETAARDILDCRRTVEVASTALEERSSRMLTLRLEAAANESRMSSDRALREAEIRLKEALSTEVVQFRSHMSELEIKVGDRSDINSIWETLGHLAARLG